MFDSQDEMILVLSNGTRFVVNQESSGSWETFKAARQAAFLIVICVFHRRQFRPVQTSEHCCRAGLAKCKCSSFFTSQQLKPPQKRRQTVPQKLLLTPCDQAPHPSIRWSCTYVPLADLRQSGGIPDLMDLDFRAVCRLRGHGCRPRCAGAAACSSSERHGS